MFLIHNNYHITNSKCVSFGPIQVLICDIKCILSDYDLARFICVYCPPNCDLNSSLSFFKALESNIAPLKSPFPIVIMGDFNLTKIDWYSMRPTLNHTNADRQLILTSQRSHLIQTVLLPTHHTNITDLLFISIDNIITTVSVDMPFAIRFDLFTPHKPRPIPNKISQLDFNRIDHAGYLPAFYLPIGTKSSLTLILLMLLGITSVISFTLSCSNLPQRKNHHIQKGQISCL